MNTIRSIIQRKFEKGYSLEDLLNSNLDEKSRDEKLLQLIEDDSNKKKGDLAFGGLMVGDFIYDYLRLDPNVINAVDFSRKENITDLFEFSNFSEKISGSDLSSFDGNIHNIKGYVGEHMIAQNLQSQGYEVEFPKTSNNEGFDLLVNGEKFQVKISTNGQSIRDHLAEHPDIPVFTNGDIPKALTNNSNVFPINGITEQGLEETTRASLDAGTEIFDIEIPGILTAVVVGKNVFRLLTGDTDIENGIYNAAEEAAGRGVGAYMGANMVAIFGGALGPYGVIVGNMIGAVVGNSIGNRIVQNYKENWRLKDESKSVNKSLKIFLESAHKNALKAEKIFNKKTNILLENLSKTGDNYRPLYNYVENKVKRERSYLKDQIQKLKNAINNTHVLVPSHVDSPNLLYISGQAVFTAMKAKVHPYSVDKELKELTKSVDIFRKKYSKL